MLLASPALLVCPSATAQSRPPPQVLPSPAVPAPAAAGGVPSPAPSPHPAHTQESLVRTGWHGDKALLGVEAECSPHPKDKPQAVLGYLGPPLTPCSQRLGTRVRKRPPPWSLTAAPSGDYLRRALRPPLPRDWLCTKGWGSGLSRAAPVILAPNTDWGASDLHVTSWPASD